MYSFAQEACIDPDTALRVADGFGAGMGRKQEVCGAVSGGVMVIGLLFGKGENENREQKNLVYSKVRHFIDEFEHGYGTVNCKSFSRRL